MPKNKPSDEKARKAILGISATVPSSKEVSATAREVGIPLSMAALRDLKARADKQLTALNNQNYQVKTQKNESPDVKQDRPTRKR